MKNKKILTPILGMIGGLLIVMLLVFPMLSMEVKNIPVGIISLDEGMITPAGKVNAGEKLVSNIIKKNNKVINFKKAKSEKALKTNLDKGKYYATITIPKDFTKNSLQKNSKVDIVINEGINPMVTMQLSTGLSALGKNTGIVLDLKSVNSISKYGLKAMILPMMLIIMTFVTSLLTSFLITENVKDDNKVKGYLKQFIYILFMAFLIGFLVSSIAIGIAGIDVNLIKPSIYLSLVSFALMLLVNGVVCLFGKKGMIIPMFLFILGMSLATLPYEFLNEAWQVLIASWEPFRYIGIGLREVLYQNHGVFNSALVSIIVLSVIGIFLSLINVYKSKQSQY